MKSTFLTLFTSVSLLTFSCNISGSETTSELIASSDSVSINYQCPKQCQGCTIYTTKGKCPVCEIDLVSINNE